jgi:NAD(P)-dependent dehydrogenase (short-subunit alcohol dehydrogenase family)
MAAVLITGANRGLGFEFARQYATDGWRALTACRNPATAGELRRLAQDRRGRLNVVAMDVTDAQSVREAATQLKDISIDVLINSAGIAGTARGLPVCPDKGLAMSITNPGPKCSM